MSLICFNPNVTEASKPFDSCRYSLCQILKEDGISVWSIIIGFLDITERRTRVADILNMDIKDQLLKDRYFQTYNPDPYELDWHQIALAEFNYFFGLNRLNNEDDYDEKYNIFSIAYAFLSCLQKDEQEITPSPFKQTIKKRLEDLKLQATEANLNATVEVLTGRGEASVLSDPNGIIMKYINSEGITNNPNGFALIVGCLFNLLNMNKSIQHTSEVFNALLNRLPEKTEEELWVAIPEDDRAQMVKNLFENLHKESVGWVLESLLNKLPAGKVEELWVGMVEDDRAQMVKNLFENLHKESVGWALVSLLSKLLAKKVEELWVAMVADDRVRMVKNLLKNLHVKNKGWILRRLLSKLPAEKVKELWVAIAADDRTQIVKNLFENLHVESVGWALECLLSKLLAKKAEELWVAMTADDRTQMVKNLFMNLHVPSIGWALEHLLNKLSAKKVEELWVTMAADDRAQMVKNLFKNLHVESVGSVLEILRSKLPEEKLEELQVAIDADNGAHLVQNL